jgi:N-acyl-D-amino-acid deacylase
MPDVVITGGEVHDGGGAPPVHADVEITGDRITRIGPPAPGRPAGGALVVDAAGQAVGPGFINILSHSNRSILHDPRSLGELTQGVTTEVFGEGTSMGPLSPRMRAELEQEAASTTGRPQPASWTACARWWPRRWPTARWASPRR